MPLVRFRFTRFTITKFHITVSGSSATETCVLKQLIAAEFAHSASSEFHASMTVLLNENVLISQNIAAA